MTTSFKRMTELLSTGQLTGKRVLVREDLNVPLVDGKVSSDARIQAALPTLKMLIDAGAQVMVMSHLGRPTEGQHEEKYSLQPVANYLSTELGQTVHLKKDWLDGAELANGELILCENVRFNLGEKANEENLSRKMATLCDVFVMDAFGTAHRAQASTEGVARYAPVAVAGPLLCAELDGLEKALKNPARPVLAIVGGSKVSTKLTVLGALSDKVDQLIAGGGIANTFIAASGYEVGKSLVEMDLCAEARALMAAAKAKGSSIPVPEDVVVALEFSADASGETKAVGAVNSDEIIFDIGPLTAEKYRQLIMQAGTVIWNGPVGVFEFPAFAAGTEALARAIADSPAFSIAGGGDTLAAIDQFGIRDDISCISTGGGAFLEYLEGKTLPAVAILELRVSDE
ncbi:MAG: phosphoglycerate kinase [Xanthomonadales bacterium]|nr:phosphoglycerate kinase [Xanthomonadales bacterium]